VQSRGRRKKARDLRASSNSHPWITRTGQVGNDGFTTGIRWRKREKGWRVHRGFACVLGEAGDDHGGRISPVSCEEEVNDWKA
jgi:hypothetical protein